jgi:hypothetical protein
MSPDPDQALVTIKRKSEIWGAQYPWMVFVDDHNLEELRYRRTLTFYASPGAHTVTICSPKLVVPIVLVPPIGVIWSEPFSFSAQAGERIELLARATGYSGRPKVWRRVDRSNLIRQAGFPPLGNLPPSVPSQLPVRGEAIASASGLAMAATYTVIEGSRYEIPLGEETRIVDNSRSSSSALRVVRLVREWTRTCSLEVTDTTTVHAMPFRRACSGWSVVDAGA